MQQAGEALQNIVHSSAQSSDLVALINQSASEQATRAEDMLHAVGSIREIAQVTHDRVNLTKVTSEQLTQLSGELDQRLSKFSLSN